MLLSKKTENKTTKIRLFKKEKTPCCRQPKWKREKIKQIFIIFSLTHLKHIYIIRSISSGVISSAGRASPLQGECRRFDPVITHHFFYPNSKLATQKKTPHPCGNLLIFSALSTHKPIINSANTSASSLSIFLACPLIGRSPQFPMLPYKILPAS